MITNKVILIAGQSNPQGRADANNLPSGLDITHFSTRIYTGSNLVLGALNRNNNRYGGAQGVFCGGEFHLTELADFWGEDFYIVKIAVDNSNLFNLSGSSDGSWHPSAGEHYTTLTSAIGDLSTWMNSRGKQWNVVGFIWHQGEADADDLAMATAYESNQTTFFNSISSYLGYTPFIYDIQLNTNLTGRDHTALVEASKANIQATNSSKYRLINQDDCPLPDGAHLEMPGFNILMPRLITQIKADTPT